MSQRDSHKHHPYAAATGDSCRDNQVKSFKGLGLRL